MKKIIIALLVFFMFNVSDAYAAGVTHGYSSSFVNKCTEDGTCLLTCGYTNKVQVNNSTTDTFSSYIYYDFKNQKFFVEWISQETDINKAKHRQYLGHKYIFIDDKAKDNLLNLGICPTNSYIDVNGMGFASEVCFSGNNSYCSESSGAGTTFKGSSSLVENYQSRLKLYFENLEPEAHPTIDPSYDECENIRNQNKDFERKMTNHISEDFLKGNYIPTFLSNSEFYKESMENLKQSYVNYVENVCDKEVDDMLENGDISQEEADKLKGENAAGLETIVKDYESAEEKIKEGTTGIKAGDLELNVDMDFSGDNCDALLGDPKDSANKPPAYYLQFIFNLMKYAAILMLLGLTIAEFIKATASGKEDAIPKALKTTLKRAIIAVVIFFLPMLIEFVLELFGLYGTCGIS